MSSWLAALLAGVALIVVSIAVGLLMFVVDKLLKLFKRVVGERAYDIIKISFFAVILVAVLFGLWSIAFDVLRRTILP